MSFFVLEPRSCIVASKTASRLTYLQCNRMIQYNVLPIPSARHRSPSPPPIYDPDTGERTNTREDRVRTKVQPLLPPST